MNELLSAPSVPECAPEWQSRPVGALATHISGVYHERMRDELPALIRQGAAMTARFNDWRVFQFRALTSLLAELLDEVDAHDWTEDDLLFPVLAAYDNPKILMTTLTPDRLFRLVDQLTEEHLHIRKVLARITAHIDAASERAAETPEWAELNQRVERLRDFTLEELDLEDRCLLPRARAIAEADSRLGA
jgi:iron-sulfur cluster repair protein YtfE (RIC family)